MATDASALKHGAVGNENNGHGACCNTGGPGYATPLEAMPGPREALIYVTCVYTVFCSEIEVSEIQLNSLTKSYDLYNSIACRSF
uniref:Uncharacterized protein n=1 Tax=Quercus lobata TaxID=97700 RepID=A0A7N2KSG7_QUELO